jgi:hypothetical protein
MSAQRNAVAASAMFASKQQRAVDAAFRHWQAWVIDHKAKRCLTRAASCHWHRHATSIAVTAWREYVQGRMKKRADGSRATAHRRQVLLLRGLSALTETLRWRYLKLLADRRARIGLLRRTLAQWKQLALHSSALRSACEQISRLQKQELALAVLHLWQEQALSAKATLHKLQQATGHYRKHQSIRTWGAWRRYAFCRQQKKTRCEVADAFQATVMLNKSFSIWVGLWTSGRAHGHWCAPCHSRLRPLCTHLIAGFMSVAVACRHTSYCIHHAHLDAFQCVALLHTSHHWGTASCTIAHLSLQWQALVRACRSRHILSRALRAWTCACSLRRQQEVAILQNQVHREEQLMQLALAALSANRIHCANKRNACEHRCYVLLATSWQLWKRCVEQAALMTLAKSHCTLRYAVPEE